jgi:hypothetical protein
LKKPNKRFATVGSWWSVESDGTRIDRRLSASNSHWIAISWCWISLSVMCGESVNHSFHWLSFDACCGWISLLYSMFSVSILWARTDGDEACEWSFIRYSSSICCR